MYVSKRTRIASLFAVLLLIIGGPAAAQTMAVSGNPGALHITTAVPGSQPTSVSNNTTTYTVTTPNANKTYRITAQINANMPVGVTLTATFAAPAGATSVGPVALDVTARNVVTGVPKSTNSTQSITYQLSGTAAAGVIASSTRMVTLTVITP